ncbi:hypothetical protein CDD81_7232 [Ophiocordyceps australis]|uniref:Zn(2)-C6 fungal-type domain-containing protein n=1 Tax=Ophiocordyceps australis TaxID=1399860 RepID=A0A2C5Y502_9HYPO|nr:hypothetical protein CDD81_7232 [Ophiocordyceps australis]
MVTTTCFPSTASRRYSSFRTPYLPSYVDRKVVEHRDAGCNMGTEREGSGSEDVSSQRKRIAVACGRCRKRKIRCSGDAGNGQPCTNCKTAGYEPCQFLRVSSQEVSQVKGSAFSYNLDASRIAQARGSSSVIAPLCVPVSPYAESLGGVGDSPLPPRASAYSSKQYYQGWGGGGGYADDSGVEYALCQPSMQTVSESSYLTGPYRISSSGSGASSASAPSAAAAKSAGSGLVYLDTEAAYGYGSVSVAGDRQSEGPETACLPYPSLTSAALPRTSAERLPATGLRTLPSPASHAPPSYRVDAMSDYRKTDSPASSSTPVLDMAGGGYHGYDSAQQLSYAATHSMAALSRSGSIFAADGSLVHGAGSAMRASSGGGYRFADAAFNHHEQSQQHQQRQHHRQAGSTDMASGTQALVFHKDGYGQDNHGIGHRKSPARTRA